MGLMKMMRREPNSKTGKLTPEDDESKQKKTIARKTSSDHLNVSDKTIDTAESIKRNKANKKKPAEGAAFKKKPIGRSKSFNKRSTLQKTPSLERLMMNKSSDAIGRNAGGGDGDGRGDKWGSPLEQAAASSSKKKQTAAAPSSSSEHRRKPPQRSKSERSRKAPMKSKSENLSAMAQKKRAAVTRHKSSDLSQSTHSKKGVRKGNSGAKKHKVGGLSSNSEPHVSKLLQMRAKQELENQREAMSKLNQERQDLSTSKKRVELKLQKEERKNEELNQDVKDLDRKLETAKAKISSAINNKASTNSEELDELTSENAELKLKLKRERRETEQVVFQKDEEIGKLNEKLEKMEAERGAENSSLNSGMSIGRLRDDLTQSRTKVKDLERTVTHLEREISAMGQELKSSRERNTVSTLKQNAGGAGSDVEQLTKENKELKSKMEFKDETVEHLMEQLKKLKLSRGGDVNASAHGRKKWAPDSMDRSGHGAASRMARGGTNPSFPGMESDQPGAAATAKAAVNDLWNKISPGTLRRNRQVVGGAGRAAMAAPTL